MKNLRSKLQGKCTYARALDDQENINEQDYSIYLCRETNLHYEICESDTAGAQAYISDSDLDEFVRENEYARLHDEERMDEEDDFIFENDAYFDKNKIEGACGCTLRFIDEPNEAEGSYEVIFEI